MPMKVGTLVVNPLPRMTDFNAGAALAFDLWSKVPVDTVKF